MDDVVHGPYDILDVLDVAFAFSVFESGEGEEGGVGEGGGFGIFDGGEERADDFGGLRPAG